MLSSEKQNKELKLKPPNNDERNNQFVQNRSFQTYPKLLFGKTEEKSRENSVQPNVESSKFWSDI